MVAPGRFWVFGVPYTWTVVLGPALALYAHSALLTHQLARRRYARYLAGAVAATLLGAGILACQAAQPAPAQRPEVALGITFNSSLAPAPTLPAAWRAALGQATANVLLLLALATAAHYARQGITRLWQLQRLRAQQFETELNLLKAQVNQHFLFNTLNNFYGLSLTHPERLPEALLQLADLLRYQLDSSRHTPVTVGTETDYLRNYIALEKLRLPPGAHVDFRADLDQPDQPLAPLLLLPLVENCFKHAIGPSGENRIRIHLSQTDAGLTLRTDNSIPPHFRPAPSGLGLPTLRARLAQFYPGSRHRLAIEASETSFTANLQLVL